jgi:prepilin-type N-terminal cleavage/methylation domain-containing protein
MLTKRAVGFASTRGFTIIEMGIVLVIISLVVGAAVSILGPVRDGRRAELTNQRLDVIQKALQVYVIQNGCLPCPTDGTKASTPANASVGQSMDTTSTAIGATCVTAGTVKCLQVAAVVPWVTLGISEDDITDGWGDRIRYAVAGDVTTTPVCVGGVATPGTLHLTNGMVRTPGATGCYPQGDLTVTDQGITPNTSTTTAAYVLVSSGPDQALALRANTGVATGDRFGQSGGGGGQDKNSNGGTSFVTGTTNANTDNTHFDDIVRYDVAPSIIQLCGSNACGNPA